MQPGMHHTFPLNTYLGIRAGLLTCEVEVFTSHSALSHDNICDIRELTLDGSDNAATNCRRAFVLNYTSASSNVCDLHRYGDTELHRGGSPIRQSPVSRLGWPIKECPVVSDSLAAPLFSWTTFPGRNFQLPAFVQLLVLNSMLPKDLE